MISSFETFKTKFSELCREWDLPTPEIKESYDFENHTDADEIWVHVVDEHPVITQVSHIFGHWLAHVHDKDDVLSDKVANGISDLILKTSKELGEA